MRLVAALYWATKYKNANTKMTCKNVTQNVHLNDMCEETTPGSA